jgi:hypothetical protein
VAYGDYPKAGFTQDAFKTVDEAFTQWTAYIRTQAELQAWTPSRIADVQGVAVWSHDRWSGASGVVRVLLENAFSEGAVVLTPDMLNRVATLAYWHEMAAEYYRVGQEIGDAQVLKLAGVCGAAANTSRYELTEEQLGKLSTILIDATGASLDDVEDIADKLPDDPMDSFKLAAAAAVVGLIGWAYVSRR